MARKKGDRARLTPTDKEIVIQTYAVTQSKAETARRCGLSQASVYRVLNQADEDGDITKKARAEAAVKLASKLHVKAETLLDSISPEDMESGRIALYDKDGELAGYKYYGPSLLQKATAVGIITDKANVVQNYEKALQQDAQSGNLLMPADIGALKEAIHGKIQELRVLDIRFADENPDLVRQTQELVAEVEALEAKEAEKPDITSFDDFDNP